MKLVNGFLVPAGIPASEYDNEETIYYPHPQRVDLYDSYPFHLSDLDDDADPDLRTVFERNIGYKTKECAIMVSKAMLGINPYIDESVDNS